MVCAKPCPSFLSFWSDFSQLYCLHHYWLLFSSDKSTNSSSIENVDVDMCTYVFKFQWLYLSPSCLSDLQFLFVCFYWSIVDIHCCAHLCCTAKWLSCTPVHILFNILFHYDLSQDTEYSSLSYTIGLLFIHPVSNSFHLLIPNSQSFPPPSTLATTSLLFMSVSLFVVCT